MLVAGLLHHFVKANHLCERIIYYYSKPGRTKEVQLGFTDLDRHSLELFKNCLSHLPNLSIPNF